MLVLLGLAEVGLLGLLGWSPAAHDFPWPGLLTFAAAFCMYALAITRAAPVEPGRKSTLLVVWLVAIALRLVLLPLTPDLSDDVYRYLWDGHVQLSGTNPYLHAPADEALAPLRNSIHSLVNNPTVPTIYPPLAQLAFLLIAAGGSTLLGAKLLWLGCDLATGWVLGRIARATGRSEQAVLVAYLWAPLLVVEVAWSGHMEPIGLLALSCAIWAAVSGRRRSGTLAGVALALSALTKFAPAAALPALVREAGWRPLVAFTLTIIALYLPYASAGEALFTGLRTYGEHWWFMKGLFGVLEWATPDPVTARQVAGLVVLSVVVGTVVARFDLERSLLWIMGAGMIVTPTLHPWYVLWMLPMAALRTSRPWILLGGLAFIGYYGLGAYRASGDWIQPGWSRAALWTPFFAALVVDGVRAASTPPPGRE